MLLILNGIHSLALKRARDHKQVHAKVNKLRWESNESGREKRRGTVKAKIEQTRYKRRKEKWTGGKTSHLK